MSDISHSCLLQAIVEHAEHMPDKIALVCDAKEISYKQLKNSIWLASDYLDTLSLRKGDSINPLAELSQCILDSSNGSIINVI